MASASPAPRSWRSKLTKDESTTARRSIQSAAATSAAPALSPPPSTTSRQTAPGTSNRPKTDRNKSSRPIRAIAIRGDASATTIMTGAKRQGLPCLPTRPQHCSAPPGFGPRDATETAQRGVPPVPPLYPWKDARVKRARWRVPLSLPEQSSGQIPKRRMEYQRSMWQAWFQPTAPLRFNQGIAGKPAQGAAPVARWSSQSISSLAECLELGQRPPACDNVHFILLAFRRGEFHRWLPKKKAWPIFEPRRLLQ